MTLFLFELLSFPYMVLRFVHVRWNEITSCLSDPNCGCLGVGHSREVLAYKRPRTTIILLVVKVLVE